MLAALLFITSAAGLNPHLVRPSMATALPGGHADTRICYIGWKVEPEVWTATISGDLITHTSRLGSRQSRRIHYRGWDGADYAAVLVNGRFEIFQNDSPVPATDGTLRYKTADGSDWCATWDGEHFQHWERPQRTTGGAEVGLKRGDGVALTIDWMEAITPTEERDEIRIHVLRLGAFVPHGARLPASDGYYAFYRGHRRGACVGLKFWDASSDRKGKAPATQGSGIDDPLIYQGPINASAAFVVFVMEQQPNSPIRALGAAFHDADGEVAEKALDRVFPDLYLSKLGLAVDGAKTLFGTMKEQAELSWNSEIVGVFAVVLELKGATISPRFIPLKGAQLGALRDHDTALVNGAVLELRESGHYRLGLSVRRR